MKIALVSSKNSELEVLEPVAKRLKSKISGVEVIVKNAPSNLDIPKTILSIKNFDLVVVALYYPAESVDVKVVMEKLVDLDIAGHPTMKFISPSEDADESDEAKKITKAILQKFFGKKAVRSGTGRGSFQKI